MTPSLPPNARLPEDMETTPTPEVAVGQSGWADPLDMRVDDARRCWLPVRLSLQAESGEGLDDMLVTRLSDGFVVDVSAVDPEHLEWDVGDGLAGSFYDNQDPAHPEFLPVIEIIRARPQVNPEPEKPDVPTSLGKSVLGRLRKPWN